MHVAETAGSALCDNHLLPRLDYVGDDKARIGIGHQRPGRHIHHEILAPPAVAFAARPRHSVLGEQVRIKIERDKRTHMSACAQDHIAAAPAIAAIRSAKHDESLTPKCRGSIAPLA